LALQKKHSGRFGARSVEPPPPPPPGLTARLSASNALADILGSAHSIEDRLVALKNSDLEPRDKALVRSILTASLRHLGSIRTLLAKSLERGLPKKSGALEWYLVTAAAQILYMDIPDHSAVDLAVHAAKRDPRSAPFAGVANAVLRNIVRAKDEPGTIADAFVDTPQWLAARWTKTYGREVAAQIAHMHGLEPTLDLTVKSAPAEWAARLGGSVLPTGSVRLATHTPIDALEGYDDGAWWVQDAAAALPARLLNVHAGERVGDLCAAPGGKTAQLALTGAHVVAVDRSAERMKRVAENLTRLGLNAELHIGDALSFDAAPFDAILLDAPCSGTGTIRRHPDIAWIKRTSDIAALAALQTKMLDRGCAMLKPGGRLVYSTCSLEPEEGEQQIATLLRRNPDLKRLPISADEIGGISECVTQEGDIRTLPAHLANGDPRLAGLDGFFVARLQRK
jgi:16S rRNA (cytosine967-C5)-methyltransferase